MLNSNKVPVLDEFRPYLRLIKAYNRKNFRQTAWDTLLRSIWCALCETVLILALCLFILLSVWYLLENGSNLSKIAVALPLTLSTVQTLTISIALIMKNGVISETIDQLGNIINRRETEFFFLKIYCFYNDF